ncbi:MAG: SdrD B-like domain-containing protein, partial [Coprobacillaceae bacterium]
MKEKGFKVWSTILVLLLVFSCFTTLVDTNIVLANTEFNVQETVLYNEENSEATISLDMESIDSSYIIEEIQDPDGVIMDMESLNYNVSSNGTYVFKILYTNGLEETKQTFNKEIVVDGIEKKENEVGLNIPSVITPRINVNDGDVTIDITDYNGTSWENGAVKKVSVTVDFKDDTSADKKINFSIPEGMRYTQISTAGTFSTTGVDASILSPYTSGSPEEQAIINMKLPLKETNVNGTTKIGSTFGEVEIEVSNATERITIDFYVRVDAARYYKPMELGSPITAMASKASTQIGSVSQKVYATGDIVGTQNGDLLMTHATYTNTQVVASTDEEDSFGIGRHVSLGLYKSSITTHGTSYSYVKSTKTYIYYPEGTEFAGFYSLHADYSSYEDDPENSRVIVYGNWIANNAIVVKYKVPKNISVGTVLTNPARDYAELEYYDGTTAIKTSTNIATIYSVTVTEKSEEALKATITMRDNTDVDNSQESYHAYASFFGLYNNNLELLKNQVVEYTIDNNWLVSTVNIPFDGSIAGNSVTKVEYKTNKNNEWQEFDVSKLKDTNAQIKTLQKSQTNMDSDEYFIAVRAEIGSISNGYSKQMYPGSNGSISTYGRLASGISTATVTMSVYEKGKEDTTKESMTSTITGSKNEVKKYRSGGNITYLNKKGQAISSIISGDSFSVRLSINPFWYYYTTEVNSSQMRNPEIYLRQPKGTTISTDSITVKLHNGNVFTDWELQPAHTNAEGETLYVIKTKNLDIGYYLDEAASSRYITVQYDISTDVTYVDNYTGVELAAWGQTGYQAVLGDGLGPVLDIYDFNNNGNTSETLFSFSKNLFEVIKNENVLIQTYLTLEGEEPKDPYVEGNSNTLAYFTPGTNANYTAKIINNGTVEAEAVDVYVPIPKTGQNFGENIQSEDFSWDMKLKDKIADVEGFTFYYTTEATETNYKDSSIYHETVSDYSKVNMVKIVSEDPIPVDKTVELKVPLVVDEDFDSATDGDKIGTKNIFNPVYVVDSAKFKGTLLGTKAGTELVIAEIGGTAFLDLDSDGLYNNEDTLLKDVEVELYKKNASDDYEAVLGADSNPITTKTDTNGKYLFDYSDDLGYGTYAIKFINPDSSKYQYTISNRTNTSIDSDAIISGSQAGWVLDIDPTNPNAKFIGCGFIEYQASDLNVSVNPTPNQVKVGNTIEVGSTTTLSIWENIKDTTTPYTWEIVGDATEKAKATLTTNSDGTVTITPSALASGTTTFQMTVTIKDIYGNTKTSEPVTITIISAEPPTISISDKVVYVNDTVNLLEGLSAVDNEDNDIELITIPGATQNTIVTQSIPMEDNKYTEAGTYEVSYTVTDIYGNAKTEVIKVKVHEKPTVSATAQEYIITDSNIVNGIENNPNASWKQASDTVGQTPAVVDILGPANMTGGNDTIKYEVLSGPSSDFSEVGIYQVKYTATNSEGVFDSKTVYVLIRSTTENIDPTNTLSIDARDFTIDNASAVGLTDTIVKNSSHGNVFATKKTDTNGNISYTDVSSAVSVDATQLLAIKNATKAGGTYPLTYT